VNKVAGRRGVTIILLAYHRCRHTYAIHAGDIVLRYSSPMGVGVCRAFHKHAATRKRFGNTPTRGGGEGGGARVARAVQGPGLHLCSWPSSVGGLFVLENGFCAVTQRRSKTRHSNTVARVCTEFKAIMSDGQWYRRCTAPTPSCTQVSLICWQWRGDC